ncbi:hypothetical protein UFOVP411_15 [uncultured Caudovirales phage]|uniref:Uncharacterized protein n=1 Tax=uncultured Caudovirales phage TaxID=2100421 RepID=A0A6J5M2Z3_9CAUD|nr:hypothetical protein UFOVP411_15 [uncultured Caudovirales phage]
MPDFRGGGSTGTGASGVPLDLRPRVDIPSAAALDLTNVSSGYLGVTGTTTITSIVIPEGVERTLFFVGAAPLTHSASLQLPGGVDLTPVAGRTVLKVIGEAGGVARVTAQNAGGGGGGGTIPSGTEAAPGLPFAAETATGIYRPAANEFAVAINGVRKLLLRNTQHGLDLFRAGGTGIALDATGTNVNRIRSRNGPSSANSAPLELEASAVTLVGGALNTAAGVTLGAGPTVDLNAMLTNVGVYNSTAAITSMPLGDGRVRIVRFASAAVLTNGASLVLPTGANITTAVGDWAIFVGAGGGVTQCAFYQRASGAALAGGGGGGTPVIRSQHFTSGGSFVVPTGVTRVYLQVQASGGGGGAGQIDGGSGPGIGGHGGGGAYTEGERTVVPGETLTITLPAGGAAGAAPTGSGGSPSAATVVGSTSGTLASCGGGAGGAGGAAPSTGASGAGGTVVTSAGIAFDGESGAASAATQTSPQPRGFSGSGRRAGRGGAGGVGTGVVSTAGAVGNTGFVTIQWVQP